MYLLYRLITLFLIFFFYSIYIASLSSYFPTNSRFTTKYPPLDFTISTFSPFYLNTILSRGTTIIIFNSFIDSLPNKKFTLSASIIYTVTCLLIYSPSSVFNAIGNFIYISLKYVVSPILNLLQQLFLSISLSSTFISFKYPSIHPVLTTDFGTPQSTNNILAAPLFM